MPPLTRRFWLRLLPALAAAQQDMPAPQPLSRQTVISALGAIGLTFTDAQIDLLLPAANDQFAQFLVLRKLDIPPETPPAIAFSPDLPGVPMPRGKSTFRPPAIAVGKKLPATEELAFLSARELAALIHAKRLTSTDLTKLYLDRLKTYAPALNCVITLTEDLAIEQAREADAAQRRGHRLSALHGVPYGAKDLFDTKGIRTTWGAPPYRNRVPESDAVVVTRLQKAGTPLLAKLSMGALAQGGLWFGGLTHTPWDYTKSSSGSSAGSASATAAGLVGFSIGTETLGSIILPSARCGVAGLRPTYGRVPRAGAMTLSWTMDKVGPICRTVADCAEVLRILADPGVPLQWDARSPVYHLKVGYIADDSKPWYNSALEDLRKAGIDPQPLQLPEYPLHAVDILLDVECAAAFDDLTRQPGALETLPGQGAGDWPNEFRTARLIPAVEYLRAQRARYIYMKRFHDLMSQWDTFVSTTDSDSLTATNLTGHPQVVVPCGFVDGLPQGLLFTSRLYEEGAAMRLAHAYEQTTDWHTKHPALRK